MKKNHRGGDRQSRLLKHYQENRFLIIAFLKDSQGMSFEQVAQEFRTAGHPITRQRVERIYTQAKDYYRIDPELHDAMCANCVR